MHEILRTASALLNRQLSDPVDLGGSPRSTVLRCRTDEGGSVVVKAFTDEAEARRSFTAEAAGLALGVAGPELLAADRDLRLLVMADLGGAPTLADLLLGADPKAAERGLLDWARGLGGWRPPRPGAGPSSPNSGPATTSASVPGRTSRGRPRTPPRYRACCGRPG